MAPLTITVRNYRCIPFRRPLTFEVQSGTTFLLGLNNSGKTTILRLFTELREVMKAVLNSKEAHLTLNGLFADSVMNQGSEETHIEITLSRGGESIRINIAAGSTQKHTAIFRAALEPNSAVIDESIIEDAKKLFVHSILVPPYRTTTAYVPQGSFQNLYLGKQLVDQFVEWSAGNSVSRRKEINVVIGRLGKMFGFREFDLRASSDRAHLLVKTDDGDFRLDELGNGIAHFIVVLLNIAFHRPEFILVDEPELGLHPRMQQEFVRAIASQVSGVICASHSVGLSRSVGDRILHVSRSESGGIELNDFGTRHGTIAQSLHELGYSSFVEIGGDNILLVEGQTEIKAYREILRKFGVDQHFILWHLGGGALIKPEASEELQEVQRLNARNVFVIFDSERESANAPLRQDFQTFAALCDRLGFKVFPTDFHSTENYISQAALDAEYGSNKFQALGPYENFKDKMVKWPKNQNWKLFGRMQRQELESTELGKFVSEILCAAACKS